MCVSVVGGNMYSGRRECVWWWEGMCMCGRGGRMEGMCMNENVHE